MGEIALKNKRPFGFYVCCVTIMIERMAFYSAKYLIFFFVAGTVASGGLGLTKIDAAGIQSNLVAFTYLAPIFGGYLTDRYIGARYCVPVGMALMGLGFYAGGMAQDAMLMNVMVVLTSIGTGLFKGNVSAINGSLFKNKEQLDSAFSTQYTFVNIGLLIGTLSIGVLVGNVFAHGEVQGYRAAYNLCGTLCMIGTAWFLFGMRFLGDVGKRPFREGLHVEKAEKESVEKKPLTKTEKRKILAICLVSCFSVIFWIFWYLTYLAAYDYGGTYINMQITSNFAAPLSWFDSTNGLVCILLGPVLGGLWFKLSKRPQGDLSLFKKLALGLGFLGASFLMLVIAELTRGVGAPDTAKASLIWLFNFAVLLSFGEMLFSPLGNSFVTKHAPSRMYSMLLGVWILSSFLAGKLYKNIYEISSQYPPIQTYSVIPAILFVVAILLFVFDKKLASLLEDKESIPTVPVLEN